MGQFIRYLQGIPGYGPVHIQEGEMMVIEGLQFGQSTPYLYVEHPENFRYGAEVSRLPSEDMTTWVLTEGENGPIWVPVEDPKEWGEEAALRLVNFGERTLSLRLGSLPEDMKMFFEDVAPGEATEYQSISPGMFFADLLLAGEDDKILARIPQLHIHRKVPYSLYVLGGEEEWKGILLVDGAAYLPLDLS